MNQEKIYTIIKAPHVSEKSAISAQNNNQYVFKVAITASKPEIKEAVETLFEVKVSNVQTSIAKGKVKRFGRYVGKRKDWKKAYVALEAGHDIDLVGTEG